MHFSFIYLYHFPQSFTFKSHVKNVIRRYSLHFLCNLSHIRFHFSRITFKTAIYAFLASRQDYCNLPACLFSLSTFFNFPQNYTVRLVYPMVYISLFLCISSYDNKFTHAASILCKLHCLSIVLNL